MQQSPDNNIINIKQMTERLTYNITKQQTSCASYIAKNKYNTLNSLERRRRNFYNGQSSCPLLWRKIHHGQFFWFRFWTNWLHTLAPRYSLFVEKLLYYSLYVGMSVGLTSGREGTVNFTGTQSFIIPLSHIFFDTFIIFFGWHLTSNVKTFQQ